jgi:hypothetical protein
MNKIFSTTVGLVLLMALTPLAANAQPAPGPFPGPIVYWAENGHYYQVVDHPSITWTDAEIAARGLTHPDSGAIGHLVTITSAAENAFLADNFILDNNPYWLGGLQNSDNPTTDDANWEWVTGEAWSYTNWGIGQASLGSNPEPNDGIDTDNTERGYEDALGLASWLDATEGTWNDAPTAFNYSNAGYIVEYDATTEVVIEVPDNPEDPVLIFNQGANNPASPNPLTAAYQEVLEGGAVTISCCRVLDTREGAGASCDESPESAESGKKGKKKKKKKGKSGKSCKGNHDGYERADFDIGYAVGDTSSNPSCAAMPYIANNNAMLRPWQRGIPRIEGEPFTEEGDLDPDGFEYREHDLGVCLIQAEPKSKGVVFSEEETSNVLGYSVNCAEEDVNYRPFTGFVRLPGDAEPVEVDFPYVTRRSADCDRSRSASRYSDNVIVLNLRHDRDVKATKPYLSKLTDALKKSIKNVKMEGCVDNSQGFLDDLASLVKSAKKDMGKKGKADEAVETLDEATRLALLLDPLDPGNPAPPLVDPYNACPDNPKGLFVSRLMSLKFAVCSELAQAGPGEDAKSLPGSLGNCPIASDILAEMPPLPPAP